MSEKFNKSMKKINLRASNDKPLRIDPDTIPNLVPEKILSQWMDGDDSPYYKIQKIDFPLMANGYNYTKSFFESYVSKLNQRPIPGAKFGHETSWGARGATDIILIGAKIDNKKNDKGSVFLKNYIPPEGENGSNEILIKEAKSGMVEFSLVSYTRDERIEKPDGASEWNVVESMFGERNDIVGVGEGAMEQKTNNIDNKTGENRMDKKEILAALKTLKVNLEITLPEIAKSLGLESLLITDDQKANLAKHNTIVKLCGDADPAEFIEGLVKERKENADAVRSSRIDKEFGPEVFEDTKKANQGRAYAVKILGTDELTDEKVNEIKEDEAYKTLAALRADYMNPENDLGILEDGKKNNSTSSVDGVKVRKI